MNICWLDFAWGQMELLKDTLDILPDVNDEAQIECAADMVKTLRELADVIEHHIV